MKKILAVILPVVIIAAGIIVFGFMKSDEKEPQCCAKNEGTGEISENSIYQSETKWVDQNNQNVMLKDYKGKPVVLTMFFASCTYACPMLVNDMKKIEAALPKEKLNEFKFILISIDPERDTPEKLKKYAELKGLDLSKWTLLSGKSEDVMELAAMIGFKYKKESNGEYSHSNLITILNEDGEIAHQQVGLNVDPAATVNEIKNL